jgi:hypothetical protein
LVVAVSYSNTATEPLTVTTPAVSWDKEICNALRKFGALAKACDLRVVTVKARLYKRNPATAAENATNSAI